MFSKNCDMHGTCDFSVHTELWELLLAAEVRGNGERLVNVTAWLWKRLTWRQWKKERKMGQRKVKGRKTRNRSREAWSFMIFEKRNKGREWVTGTGKGRNIKRGGSLTRWRRRWYTTKYKLCLLIATANCYFSECLIGVNQTLFSRKYD